MITATYSTTAKDITSAQLWKLMSNVNEWKTWDSGTEDSGIDGAFIAGNSFWLKPKGGPKVRVQLLEVRPTSYFEDVTRFPFAQMYDEHTYEDTAEGLHITSTLTMKGPLAFLWNKIVMQDIVAKLPKDIAVQVEAARNLT